MNDPAMLVGNGCSLLTPLGLAAEPATFAPARAPPQDDSAFHTSPLDSGGISAKRAQIFNFIWGSAGFPSSKMPAVHRFVTSPVAGLTNLQSVEVLQITMDAGQYSIGYHFLPAVGTQ